MLRSKVGYDINNMLPHWHHVIYQNIVNILFHQIRQINFVMIWLNNVQILFCDLKSTQSGDQCVRSIVLILPTELLIQHSLHYTTLQCRHNERDGVLYHQPHHCLFKRLFKAHIKENIKIPRHRLCERNSPVTGEFPAQTNSNAGYVSVL